MDRAKCTHEWRTVYEQMPEGDPRRIGQDCRKCWLFVFDNEAERFEGTQTDDRMLVGYRGGLGTSKSGERFRAQIWHAYEKRLEIVPAGGLPEGLKRVE